MIVRKYPADFGHTTVINNLCIELTKMGYKTGIGAFTFDSPPPPNVEQVKLSKIKLLLHGIDHLNYDIVNPHQAFPCYFLLTRKPTKPIVLHYHGASSKLQQINFKIFMKFYKKRISKIISVSQAGINQMRRMIGDVSAEVVYNGVDIEYYNPNLPTPYKKGDPQLLFVSALRPYKKASVLIDSMPELIKKFSKIHLQIVGSGKEIIHLNNLIKEKNLQNYVELTGKISNEDLKLRYSSCDIYVSASTFEVCPVPTLEAMACGKPLVLFDIDPHREIIELSNAGKIFSFDSNSNIVKMIDQVYKNKDFFKTFALKFAQDHNWKLISKQVIKIFENLD